ncbi:MULTISPECIES: hypothetical protein [unclassified Gordonia (in: high G+C Gram-positive bacteria)]
MNAAAATAVDATAGSTSGPLSDLRVVEMGQLLAGRSVVSCSATSVPR